MKRSVNFDVELFVVQKHSPALLMAHDPVRNLFLSAKKQTNKQTNEDKKTGEKGND